MFASNKSSQESPPKRNTPTPSGKQWGISSFFSRNNKDNGHFNMQVGKTYKLTKKPGQTSDKSPAELTIGHVNTITSTIDDVPDLHYGSKGSILYTNTITANYVKFDKKRTP